MNSIADRYGNALVGITMAIVFIGFAVWIAPIFGASLFQISFVIGAFVVAYSSYVGSEWLNGRQSQLAVLAGRVCAGISIVRITGLIIGFLFLVVWAQFNAPASDCMRCD